MRYLSITGLIIVFALAGCNDQITEPDHFAESTLHAKKEAAPAPSHHQGTPLNFSAAPLKGGQEVPAVDSDGTGTAQFKLSKDGTELHYKLIVSNLDDVTQAHIHLAERGANGGVVAFLFGFVAGGVEANGLLAEGIITADDLTGTLTGQPLSALVEVMQEEGAYVNVHTVAHPAGEIRGQIDHGSGIARR